MPAPVDAIALSQALIRRPSVTPEDAGALNVLQEALTPAGFACQRLVFGESGTADVANLFALFGTDGPHLCFAGHTDVVPPGDAASWLHPPFDAVIENGVLYGRGAQDMKTAVAAFAAAAIDWAQEQGGNPPGRVSMLITGDEEGPAINGTRKVLGWMAEHGHIPDACIVGEPTCTEVLGDTIKNGRRGSLNLFITATGVQGHTAYPEKALNPVHALSRLIDRMASTPLDDGTRHFQPSTVVFSQMHTDHTATNVIPQTATAVANVRFNTRHTAADIERWAHRQAEAVAEQTGVRFDIRMEVSGEAFITEEGPILEVARAAVAEVTGVTPQLSTGGGTSDARFIKDHCPVIEFGLVNDTIHQVNERANVADIERLKAVYRRMIDLFFARAAG